MLVQMRTRYCSPKAICDPGKTIDVPEAEAKALIDGGYAVKAGESLIAKARKALRGGNKDE